MEPTEKELEFLSDENDSDDEEDYDEDEDYQEWKLLQEFEQEEKEMEAATENNEQQQQSDDSIDWLQTRRSKLGIGIETPSDASRVKRQQYELPIKEHTLLSLVEITFCLHNLGGKDIVCLDNSRVKQSLNVTGGLVLVTALSASHVVTLADAVVYNLKKRNLASMGVVAAQFGSEAASKHDTWRVVDCQNYILHIFDETTRQHLQLEQLWGKDENNNMHEWKEEDWDDYVENHPVPDNFYAFSQTTMWTESTISQLQKNQWEPPHLAVQKKRPKRSKSKKKRSRNRHNRRPSAM